MKKFIGVILFLLLAFAFSGPAFTQDRSSGATNGGGSGKLTFIELGSVNCIPCKAMQPVMDQITLDYSDQVEVVFYDVWTVANRSYAKLYNIRVIPTQVFLDREGKEYFRHEGFFPLEEVLSVLEDGGLKR